MKPRHVIEAAATVAAAAVFRVLPLDAASAVGGWLFRAVGPLLSVHRIAERNLRAALPALDDDAVAGTLDGMWDNLGRVAVEYAQLDRIAGDPERFEVVDPDKLLDRTTASGGGAIFVSAHFGNWEVASFATARAGIRQTNVYRAPNNPLVETILRRARRDTARGGLYPKSRRGMQEFVKALRRGDSIGMLADQKSNEGVAIPFFGRDAMTTPVPAALAHRYGKPIVLSRVERVRGARFRVFMIDLPLGDTASGDAASGDAAVTDTTRRINAHFESWIRERPDHWLWVHRRWPK